MQASSSHQTKVDAAYEAILDMTNDGSTVKIGTDGVATVEKKDDKKDADNDKKDKKSLLPEVHNSEDEAQHSFQNEF